MAVLMLWSGCGDWRVVMIMVMAVWYVFVFGL